ncbi:hypothetical protein MLD38_031131 [Melastoma candidum]|uniref:Uncharacterized protein n=1 Tax=Melastoma candidum TaxID=119954 RepID=A0ACB9MNS9_9MYRT|nr:hypothetical protein MLD38_031131 [Melastoma candidum]
MDIPFVSLSAFQQMASNINNEDACKGNMVSRIFYITANQLNNLKRSASSNGKTRTMFESFSAFLWKIIARSPNNEGKFSKMAIIVDGRTRLGTDTTAYFGNVISMAVAVSKTSDLVENPLSTIADEVHDFLKPTVTKEHFLVLMGWVEAQRPDSWMPRIYCKGSEDGSSFVVSSGQRFPISKVDFGWGKPAFGSYYLPWGDPTGYVMPMPSPLENGDWIVYTYLLGKDINTIEMEASHVFKQLTKEYLGL